MPTAPLPPAVAQKRGIAGYYGFPHDKAFVIRSPNRSYNDHTETVKFVNGEAQIPAIPGSSPQQRWNRGERLARMKALGYTIYEAGTQPSPADEPLWRGQDAPEADRYETDFGVVYGRRADEVFDGDTDPDEAD